MLTISRAGPALCALGDSATARIPAIVSLEFQEKPNFTIGSSGYWLGCGECVCISTTVASLCGSNS
jgi:hypothetical protein